MLSSFINYTGQELKVKARKTTPIIFTVKRRLECVLTEGKKRHNINLNVKVNIDVGQEITFVGFNFHFMIKKDIAMKAHSTQSSRSVSHTALSENASKELLNRYGLPVVKEIVAKNRAEAVKAAEKIGFPVVLKGLGKHLLHKTEAGVVHLNLFDAGSVQAACDAIVDNGGDALEGILVQPQMKGNREFVAGLFHDRLFGPVIMFGLGGVFTEALADVSFRVAPLTASDAGEMIDNIRSQALLGNFRGEQAIDRDQLISILMGLSELAQKETDVIEVDINPLIASETGQLCAVDALVIKGDNRKVGGSNPKPVDLQALGKMFYPKSIALIGASATFGKWGYTIYTNVVSNGYEGEVYLINNKSETIAGQPVYRSVEDIPGPVDLAVVTIPAIGVPDLIPGLEKKGIKSMVLITSGFGETGPAGKALELEVVEKAQQAGILIIGPNTMGIVNPHIKFYCTGSMVRPDPGGITVVAQSGNMAAQLLQFAERQGIEIRAFCGSGNEAMITIEDYMEGFEIDDLTDIVMLYVESVKDGRRFLESAHRVSRKKPIVLLKGGQTEAGSRAAASHTGAMSSDSRVFNAVCRQAGIVKVDNPMDMLDLSAAFSSLPLPAGNRVGIMSLGGGWGVVASDLCSKYSLTIPDLSDDIIKRIDKILPPYWSKGNPIDLVGENDHQMFVDVFEELTRWDGCDAVLILGVLGRRYSARDRVKAAQTADPNAETEFLNSIVKMLDDFEGMFIGHIVELMEKHQKPVFCVPINSDEAKDKTLYKIGENRYKGVVFTTPERAIKSLSHMVEYKRFLLRETR